MLNLGKSHFTLRFLAIFSAVIGVIMISGHTSDALNFLSPCLGNQFSEGQKTLDGGLANLCGKEVKSVAPEMGAVCAAPVEVAKGMGQAASVIQQTGKNAENLFSSWWNQFTSWVEGFGK